MAKIVDYGFISVIWNYLLSHFKNEIGVAALMGNFYGESYLVPFIAENNLTPPFTYSQNYTDKLDSGEITENQFVYKKKGYGLAQWTIPERKKPFYDLVKLSGDSFGSWENGVMFAISEIDSGSYEAAKNAIYNASNLRDSVRTILIYYEMPQDQSENAVTRRTDYAQQILDIMSGTSPIPPVEQNHITVTPKSVFLERNVLTSVFVDASGEWECDLGSGIDIKRKSQNELVISTLLDIVEKRNGVFWLKEYPDIKATIIIAIGEMVPVPPEEIIQITPKEINAQALEVLTFNIIASSDYSQKIETGAKIIKKTNNILQIKIDGSYSRPDIKLTVFLKDNTSVQDSAIIHIKGGGKPPTASKTDFKLFYKPKIKI